MNQTDIFDGFMKGVWGDDEAEMYDDARDAGETASVMGAKPTGSHASRDGRDWNEWLFPDGSTVWIESNGSAIERERPTHKLELVQC
jgi:hypothetical protein